MTTESRVPGRAEATDGTGAPGSIFRAGAAAVAEAGARVKEGRMFSVSAAASERRMAGPVVPNRSASRAERQPSSGW